MHAARFPSSRYNQTVKSDDASTVLAELAGSNGSTTLSNPFAGFQNGFATLSDLTISAKPGASVSLGLSIPALRDQVASVAIEIEIGVCPPGNFRDKTAQGNAVCTPCKNGEVERMGVCVSCQRGMNCSSEGLSLADAPLEPGYWRASSESFDVRKCRFGAASCPGDETVTDNDNPYCGPGYVGHLCSECGAQHFKSWAGDGECHTCAAGNNHLPTILLGVCVLLLGGASAACLVQKARKQAGPLAQKVEKIYRLSKYKLFTIFLAAQVVR